MNNKILVTFFLVVVMGVTYTYAAECTTGDVKQVDCNSCRCLNGVWACTRRGCLTKRAAECTTGETKQVDCNTCFCANGNWACTLKGCLRKRAADECTKGETKQVECNTCFCANGFWACTEIGCLTKRAIPARFAMESRKRRDEHVALDLKDTPCAPNDYFQVDCNVCYCNLEHSGYLCTNNYCRNYDEATTIRIPMENDSVLILSNRGAQLVENASYKLTWPWEGKFGLEGTTDAYNDPIWGNGTNPGLPFDYSNRSFENLNE